MGGSSKGAEPKNYDRPIDPQEQLFQGQQQQYAEQAAGVTDQQVQRSNQSYNDYQHIYNPIETGMISPNATRETGYIDVAGYNAGRNQAGAPQSQALPPKPSGKGSMTQGETIKAIQESGRDPMKLKESEYKDILAAQEADRGVAADYEAALAAQQSAPGTEQQDMIYNKDPNANYHESVISGNEQNSAALDDFKGSEIMSDEYRRAYQSSLDARQAKEDRLNQEAINIQRGQ